MATGELMRICVVGGNAVSAFLSWRLQASNACDVTVVWKRGHAHVSQYGISFKSQPYGNERFKPRRVLSGPEDPAAAHGGPYDYVILSIKALPEVYDAAAAIERFVTPNHTCIILNTTQSVGAEAALEERYPSNMVLSLVCDADLVQIGPSEFEHRSFTEIWIGPALKDDTMAAVQADMAHALEITLSSGGLANCRVSSNIRQQQYERVAGPIAFYPLSIIFETPNHQALLDKPGARELVSEIIDEILGLATAHGCRYTDGFKQKTIEDMTRPETAPESPMWQDYVARRPIELDTYLGAPIRLAKESDMSLPRLETLYTILRHINVSNQQKPKGGGLWTGGGGPMSPGAASPMLRNPPPPNHHGPMPRPMGGGGPPNGNNMGRPPMQKPRGPSNAGPYRPQNGGHAPSAYRPPGSQYGSRQASRRGSLDTTTDLEEFSHILQYGEPGADSGYDQGRQDMPRPNNQQWDQRSLHGPQRRPMGPGMGPQRMGPGPGPLQRRPPQPPVGFDAYGDDDDDDDFLPFDPSGGSGPPLIDPDNFDMMSLTSRKNRKVPGSSQAQAQFRRTAEAENSMMSRAGRFLPSFGRRDRTSQIVSVAPLGENILDDPMMAYSSNRYGNVDRGVIAESRTNSITSQRYEELQYGPGPGMAGSSMMGPGGMPRRPANSPAHFGPQMRGPMVNTRQPSAQGGGPMMSPVSSMYPGGGRPSPADSGRYPARFPSGNVGPPAQNSQQQPQSPHPQSQQQQQQQQQLPMSPSGNSPLQSAAISLTGSASASANSGDTQVSTSDQSATGGAGVQNALAHGSRPAVGVR